MHQRRAKDIFLRALQAESNKQRNQIVDDACGQDHELRERVLALLRAENEPQSFLDRPAAEIELSLTEYKEAERSSLSDSSSHHGRFLPGTKLAERYRIVSLLGRGGMGEVYRADDLKLDQTVALKFLPANLAKDPKRLEYFHNEVRMARQVSHPSVCRVYDLGEVDGQPFISMEYVDGEDLKTLLQRIGRLPPDKGAQISQQLCAGLSAAHSRGVLHRDLKPANIMIDGQGHVRITDFGLATVATQNENVIGMSGTPAYMAPEQLLRGQTSVQSDLYSLGLILHEVFAGEKANQATSLEELRRLHESSSTTDRRSSLPPDLDPAISRAIQRCLAVDPVDRPPSSAHVGASLPGGDPLQAALAAGETPAPELVAASGGAGALKAPVALGCFALILILFACVVYFGEAARGTSYMPLDKPPAYLRERAKEIIQTLGYTERPFDIADGFTRRESEIRYAGKQAGQPGENQGYQLLVTSPWAGVHYWYRQSRYSLVGTANFQHRVGEWNPAHTAPGMINIRLHPSGKLHRFQVMPDRTEVRDTPTESPAWQNWFDEDLIGLDLSELDSAVDDWAEAPDRPFDAFQAWEGEWPGTEEGVRVTAAAYRGKPVWLNITSAGARDPNRVSQRFEQNTWLLFLVGFLATALAMFTAAFHLKTGRGDRQGAIRIGVFAFLAYSVAWFLLADHVAGAEEFQLLKSGLGKAMLQGAVAAILYLAVEPLIRRVWPELLVSLTRLLQGHYRDARVGRDAVIGILTGLVGFLICFPLFHIFDPEVATFDHVDALASSKYFVANAIQLLPYVLTMHLSMLLTFWVLLALVRHKPLAVAAFYVLTFVLVATQYDLDAARFPFILLIMISAALIVFVLLKFGSFSIMVHGFTFELLRLPMTSNIESFYFSYTVIVGLVLIGVAGFAAHRSLWRIPTRFG